MVLLLVVVVAVVVSVVVVAEVVVTVVFLLPLLLLPLLMVAVVVVVVVPIVLAVVQESSARGPLLNIFGSCTILFDASSLASIAACYTQLVYQFDHRILSTKPMIFYMIFEEM